MIRLPLISLFFLLVACGEKAPNKFADSTIIKIYDLKDRRSSDSLATFLNSEDPLYRREAALAFGSIQDSSISNALGNILLEDVDPEARRNAAFALGQTGGFMAVNALIPAVQDKDPQVVREVIEALGKTIERKDISVLKSFKPSDSLLQEGLAWGLYRLSARNRSDSLLTIKAADLVSAEHSFQTRLGAATYFGRSPKISGNGFQNNLIEAALHDVRPEVRMMAVLGFRHIALEKVSSNIQTILRSEKDYRVRINAVRACQNFSSPEIFNLIRIGLTDSVEMVRVTASEVIRNKADQFAVNDLITILKESKDWRVTANIYAARVKRAPAEEVMDEIITQYKVADIYFKSGLLSALGEAKTSGNEKSFSFLSQELMVPGQEKVLLTSAAAGLTALDRKKQPNISRQKFLDLYKTAIGIGDPAVIGIVASSLMDTSLHYKKEIKDLQFLYDAKSKLELPRDIESLQPLERAIAFFEDKPVPATNNEFNHPINWELAKTIRNDQKISITTTKGKIVISLLVEEAPGSVVNFVELVNKMYYDKKFFHRVIPNFVDQAGCNRGDGYGSEDYSIRSEFSLRRYTTGSLGMASAGKDTEGTQWFITHSPTPHLDGRYTIFAEVIEGIGIAHKIEVGDQILEVRLLEE